MICVCASRSEIFCVPFTGRCFRTLQASSKKSPAVRTLLSHEPRQKAKKFYHRILVVQPSFAIWQRIQLAKRIRSRVSRSRGRIVCQFSFIPATVKVAFRSHRVRATDAHSPHDVFRNVSEPSSFRDASSDPWQDRRSRPAFFYATESAPAKEIFSGWEACSIANESVRIPPSKIRSRHPTGHQYIRWPNPPIVSSRVWKRTRDPPCARRQFDAQTVTTLPLQFIVITRFGKSSIFWTKARIGISGEKCILRMAVKIGNFQRFLPSFVGQAPRA